MHSLTKDSEMEPIFFMSGNENLSKIKRHCGTNKGVHQITKLLNNIHVLKTYTLNIFLILSDALLWQIL